MQHARLSPSSAYRWSKCPGSVHLIESIAGPDTSTAFGDEYAAWGTAAHALAENILLDSGAAIAADDEMMAVVQPYVDYVNSRPAQLRHYERRVSLDWMSPPEPIFGTPDVALLGGEDVTLEIIDLKTGYVPVSPERNEQLTLYAAAKLEGFDPLCAVRLTIVQPRAGGVKCWDATAGEIITHARSIIASMWDVKPGAPLVPGDHCRFCPARGHCPALKGHAQLVAQVDFDVVPADTPPDAGSLPIEVAADLLRKVEILDAWIAALRTRVARELEAGREVPGWKLVNKRPRRVWNSAQDVEAWAAGSGLTPADYYEPLVLASPAQIEKVVGKKFLPPELYSSVSSGVTLVPSSDPRPPAAVGPAADFAALPPARVDAEIVEDGN